jgi:hypothetical protein
MADPVPPLDPSLRAALDKLADVVTPAPVSFVPQTWGWAVLAVILVALAAWLAMRWHRHRMANRYRAEALAELARIERTIADGAPGTALAAIPPLLKRVALTAWPRARVAALTQARWAAFIRTTDTDAASSAPLARLLDDAEYRSAAAAAAMSADDARACTRAARHWIEAHRVSA